MKLSFALLAIIFIVIFMINSVFAVLAVDVSTLKSTATLSAKDFCYERVIIRGFFEVYGRNPGGAIDPNLLQNLQNYKF